jgi:proline iminopeptidase
VASETTPVEEGSASIGGYRFYWKSVGRRGPKGTVLTLHGGPGASHDYLSPFADLAARGYRVVFYDQLGCGRSDRARTDAEYSVARDVEDLDELRQALGLGRVHLLGSSYGGLLAIAYALEHPDHLTSLVSVSGLASVPLTRREMDRLRRELPPPFPAYLDRHEVRGEFTHPEYLAAVDLFYRRHLCRLPSWPPDVVRSLQATEGPKYRYMNGPNEFTITGTIRDFDVTSRLGEIRLPTLVTAGRYDEVTPVVARSIHAGIPGSEFVEFPESSHLAFWEERDRYLRTVGDFLDRHVPG